MRETLVDYWLEIMIYQTDESLTHGYGLGRKALFRNFCQRYVNVR